MRRAASTWQYQIVAHIVEGHLGGRRMGFIRGTGTLHHVPADHWRAVKLHEANHALAARLGSDQARGFYCYRDLRDVAYSLMHKLAQSFDEVVVQQSFLDRILEEDAFWRSQPNTLIQEYTSLCDNPGAAIHQIAGHLGCRLSTKEIDRIAGGYSVQANLERTARITSDLLRTGMDLRDSRMALIHDEETQLHWNHIRVGRHRSWKEATVRERNTLRRICGAWLIQRGYEANEEWGIGE